MTNEILENKNKGFSLVELIVVIAIMAVMTSVLAPSLLGYVEKSRMQKDDSAMGEVMNAVKLALADQDVYDECLTYNVKNNYSCYVDSVAANRTMANAVLDKDRDDNNIISTTTSGTNTVTDDWHYADVTRQDDETPFSPAGNMRGLTLTFTRTEGLKANEQKFALKDARVNEMKPDAVQGGGDKATLKGMTSGAAGKKDMLYNKLRAAIGDSINLSSQTYRSSEYTVFIRMGSTGGNNSAAQDAVAVYGQWNGTNLEAGSKTKEAVTGLPTSGTGTPSEP